MQTRQSFIPRWRSIDAGAWSILKNSSDLSKFESRQGLVRGLPQAMLWDDPYFGFGDETEPMSLTVYELFDDENSKVVRHAIWKRTEDYERFKRVTDVTIDSEKLGVSTQFRDALVPTSPWQTLLKKASEIRVPLYVAQETSCVTSDVGNEGLELFSADQPPSVLRYQWASNEVPEAWIPVVEWAKELRDFLLDCLSGSGRIE